MVWSRMPPSPRATAPRADPVSPDDRRPFRGAPYDRGRNDRPGPPSGDRADRPPADRPGFGAPPRPFVRPPTRGGDLPPPDHRVHLRDGDREIDVSGNPAFVRQVLDDLPSLMARLRGDVPGRNPISMPSPPESRPTAAVPEPVGQLAPIPAGVPEASSKEPSEAGTATPTRNGARNPGRRPAGGNDDVPGEALEREVFEVLRGSSRPLPIAAIRGRIDSQPTGQEVRRLLERAGERVTRSADRPATYSLR